MLLIIIINKDMHKIYKQPRVNCIMKKEILMPKKIFCLGCVAAGVAFMGYQYITAKTKHGKLKKKLEQEQKAC